MSDKTFVDTNVLIYAHDADAGPKHEIARSALEQLWAERTGVLSLQVLQEFYVNVTRKIRTPLSKASARRVVDAYEPWSIGAATSTDLRRAFQIEDDSKLGFWDALIVAAALRGGASRLLSEDLNPGQRIVGVVVENPFVAS